MLQREQASFLEQFGPKYPIITLIGPRQSGKSTLARSLYPDYIYVSLESPDDRLLAIEDPRGFFKRYPAPLIIDEVQRVPDLLSYIQTFVDEPGFNGQFVLTGSHQMLLMEKITQSLAGRTLISRLLPFSLSELKQNGMNQAISSIDTLMFTGGYPRIYDKNIPPTLWLEGYFQTYVERDVRALLHVDHLHLFDRFIRMCAGRVGQLVNFSSLASDCGISPPTAQSWLSVLQTSFVCFQLSPHFVNFNKRLVKTPKIYFYDTGLLCTLLKIQNTTQLASHPLRGSIFENWVIAELMKSYFNKGEEPPLYFWREGNGKEIDLIVDEGTNLYPIEIKSAYSFDPSFLNNLKTFIRFPEDKNKKPSPNGECVYCGDTSYQFHNYHIRSWKDVG